MRMKFSILLPTRNRLEYLRYAVESVQRQDYDDWEIVISDNDSEDDIRGFVQSLNDPRIVYTRTPKFVPVTENWNNALDRSTGDFVLMLGDDDGLLPGYFSTMRAVLERFPKPDFVYTGALFYAYPGVMPDRPAGFLRRDENRVFEEREPFWLDRERAVGVTKGYLNFEMPVASNMQFSLISRGSIDRLKAKGPVFQSPYPDFYATPALFLTSSRILICPDPMVVIGITPKSYGYFHFNNKAGEGVSFLNNRATLESNDERMLPGTSYNDSWLLASDALWRNFGREHGLTMNYSRYRFLQIVHGLKHRYYDKDLPAKAIRLLTARMTFPEKWFLRPALAMGFRVLGLVPADLREYVIGRMRRVIGQHAMAQLVAKDQSFRTLLDVYDYAERNPDPLRLAA